MTDRDQGPCTRDYRRQMAGSGRRRRWTCGCRLPILDCMVSQLISSPAPLDQAALAESLRPFGRSRMLPRAAYVDAGVFDWERRNFFGGGWLCVGRADQVASPGDQRAEPAGPGSILLTRDEAGGLRAF